MKNNKPKNIEEQNKQNNKSDEDILRDFLNDYMEYPAGKEELLDAAENYEIDEHALGRLADLPDQDFAEPEDVMNALGLDYHNSRFA